MIWDRGRLVVEDFGEGEKILFELSGKQLITPSHYNSAPYKAFDGK